MRCFFVAWSQAIFGLILLIVPALGQVTPPLYFDHLTINDGLSNNTIFTLLQDRNGYIWVGTLNGLNKYDGYDFEVFSSHGDHADESGFVGKCVTALFEDRAGHLWVGTRTRAHGINLKLAGRDQFTNLHESEAFAAIASSEITSFYEDQSGEIWITTSQAGVLKYNLSTGKSGHFSAENSGLLSNAIFDLKEDANGNIWVACSGHGISVMKRGGRFQTLFSQMNGYRKQFLLEEENLWVAIEGTGLFKVNIKTESCRLLSLPSKVPRAIIRQDEEHLFIGTDGGGLYVWDEEQEQYWQYHAGENNYLNSNALLCFLKDNNQNVWIGTYNGGINLCKANKTYFNYEQAKGPDGALNPSALSLLQVRDGSIWAGTDGSGLIVYDPTTSMVLNQAYPNLSAIQAKVIKSLYEDRRGRIWVGTFRDGLIRYNPQNGELVTFKNRVNDVKSLAGNNIWDITEDSLGNLQIATLGWGICTYDLQTDQFQQWGTIPKDWGDLPAADVMTVLIDHKQRGWIGTLQHGLIRKEASGIKRFRHAAADSTTISSDAVRVIYEDSQHRLWIGTEGGGLSKWVQGDKFEHVTEADGLISDQVMAIREDGQGFIWVSTFEGISRLNPTTNEIQNFDFRSRSDNNQFNHLAMLMTQEGKLLFGGIQGIHSIFPVQVKQSIPKPKIIFTDLSLFNESVPVGPLEDGSTILTSPIEEATHICLHHDDNSFSISFSAIDYTDPLDNIFSYKMEGFDEQWHEGKAGQHQVSYTNLNPGNYVFRVRLRKTEKSINLIVTPPFWKASWFRILAFCLICSLLFFGGRWFVKRQETLHRQKLMKVESEILRLQNEKLETEVANQNAKLMFSSVQMAQQNGLRRVLKAKIQNRPAEDTHAKRKLGAMRNQ